MPVVRIDRYDIRGRIGGGGMGTVYLARDTNPKTERLVALKLLKAPIDAEDLRHRFTVEAQSLAELSHPNIVGIYDSGEYEGSPFIVMEYVRGETLAELIRRRAPLTLGVKLRLLSELCAGLAHAHNAGLIHRDIKPANLVLDMHGHLRILDFGIARVWDPGQTRPHQRLTQLNAQVGTPGYMSPEQIEGVEIDSRSDLFAVGTVAYELLAYREAFPGANTRQIEQRVLEETPVPLTDVVAGLDVELKTLIDSALVKDVSRRCQDAATLWTGFERVRARLGELGPPLRMTPITRGSGERKSKRHRNADAAFLRAETSASEGAPEYAGRSAIEALAEQPEHEGARKLLERLGRFEDVRPWLRPMEGHPGTEESRQSSRDPLLAPDPTVLLDRMAPPRPSNAPVRQSQPAAGPPAPHVEPRPASRDIPYVALAAAVVAAVAITLLILKGLGLPWPGVTTQAGPEVPGPGATPKSWRLSIVRPDGGTVTGTGGLNCGGPLSSCEVLLADTARADLLVQPAAGYEFVRFTGDCENAPSIVMDRNRSCGATFRRIDEGKAGGATKGTAAPTTPPATTTPAPNPTPAAGATGGSVSAPPVRPVELTLEPPDHGFIVGDGIRCGREGGSSCLVTRPPGTAFELSAVASPGFRFVRFTGDCATDHEKTTVRLEAARACSATFEPIPKPAAPSNAKPLTRWANPIDALPMIWIPPPAGGRFTMGGHPLDENRDSKTESQTIHTIALSSGFWINETEVTRGAFAKCVAAKACTPGRASLDDDRLPVVGVTWPQAVDYCEWSGNRLPSEAEWEFAARGSAPITSPYFWGATFAEGSAFVNAGPTLLPVGSRKPNTNGLFDMLGNVWEWTNSLYAEYPWQPRNEDRAAKGPRVIRGGAYDQEGKFLRLATRTRKEPTASTVTVGFRCARSPQ